MHLLLIHSLKDACDKFQNKISSSLNYLASPRVYASLSDSSTAQLSLLLLLIQSFYWVCEFAETFDFEKTG